MVRFPFVCQFKYIHTFIILHTCTFTPTFVIYFLRLQQHFGKSGVANLQISVTAQKKIKTTTFNTHEHISFNIMSFFHGFLTLLEYKCTVDPRMEFELLSCWMLDGLSLIFIPVYKYCILQNGDFWCLGFS